MKQTALFAAALLVAATADAQILNIEKTKLEGDSVKAWAGNFAFSSRITDQVFRIVDFTGSANLLHQRDKHNYILIGNYNWNKFNNNQALENAYLHGRINFLKEKTLSYELFAQGQYDGIRGMRHRYLGGGGLRWRILQGDKASLSLSPGLMYEDENWSFRGTDTTLSAWKNTTYILFRLKLTENIDFNVINYYQARFDLLGKPRISGDANLNIKLWKFVSLVTQFSYFYDTVPPVPIQRLLFTLQNGIKIAF